MSGVVLITGAARRIGREIALHFAAQDYRIAAHYSRADAEARTLQAEITEKGGKISLFKADFTQAGSAEKLFESVTREMGTPGVLVNNAAMFERDDGGITGTSLDSHMRVNAAAPILLAQMVRGTGNTIVFNVLDRVLDWSWPHLPSYVLSKTALEEWTRRNAPLYAPQTHLFGLRLGPTLRNPRESEKHFSEAVTKTSGSVATQIPHILATMDRCLAAPANQSVFFDL